MFPKSSTYIDHEINKIVKMMEGEEEVTEQKYNTLLGRLEKLQHIRNDEKPDKASVNTILAVTANLVGILLIIRHEHVNVITSRAMNLVTKIR